MDDFLEKRELFCFCICLGKICDTEKYRIKVAKGNCVYHLLPDGTRDGTFQEFWKDSFSLKKQSEYKFGNLDGPLCEWAENGALLFSGNYKTGREHGLFTKGTACVSPVIMSNFVDGKLHGEYKEYHDNGEKRTLCWYDKGKQTGEATHWNKEGKVIGNGSIDPFGNYTGDKILWWENGVMQAHHKYSNGELRGLQICYSEAGRYTSIQQFHRGKRISEYNYKG
ncbi:putative MORN repeat protein [Tokyovirus A1]|uniref:putative MORN repeat protein n=1 Tax=Tokyovirus A1 TaxID=1826170 RepID=UPI0007A98B0A|nr:putative MORN repeat protein [Tokyovirus A1]BAU79948.1 putative MORN repeat protein [Tokyovirus A1]